MNKIFEKIKQMQKVNKIILGVIILLLLLIVFALISREKNTLRCSKEISFVNGIDLKENINIRLNKNKVYKIYTAKNIKLSPYYSMDSSYINAIEDRLKDAYSFMSDSEIKFQKSENDITVETKTKKTGFILNNISILEIESGQKGDIRINVDNSLSKSEKSIKINDSYKMKELKEKIEKEGYKCKK